MKKEFIFSIFVFVFFFLLLELGARLLESKFFRPPDAKAVRPGWQTEFFSSLFDWHENDPDLLWRFKAGLNNPLIKTNSRHLIGTEVSERKSSKSFRILLLGDSVPVGLGLKSYKLTFGEILKQLLISEFGERKNIELVNAAVSGYTSEQIVRFLDLKGWDYKPDLVILYCGNNDASISGIYSDRELLESQKFKPVRKLFSHSAFYRVLKITLLKNVKPDKQFDQSLKVRVSPDRYGTNLTEIARQCQEKNCPLIILKPAVPYLWPAGLQFKLFTHITGEDSQLIIPDEMVKILGRNLKYCLSRERFAELYGQGDIFTRSVYSSAYNDGMLPEEAITYYTELVESDTNNPVLLNNLGVSLWQDEQYNKADYYLKSARSLFIQQHKEDSNPIVLASGSPFLYNIGINLLSEKKNVLNPLEDTISAGFNYLDSALQSDFLSLRIKKSYWEEIDEVKEEKNVLVIDLPLIFRANGGEKLFIDHCHPTAAGHQLIAQELFRIISKQLEAR